ncbi:hypothetical protein SLA2020_167580 [Shorea laevis]
MEEKRRDAANSPAGPSSVEGEPASTRRRAGAQKRKANALAASSPSSLPSKRITREKSNLMSQSSIIHNGPLTRARYGAPSNLSSAAGSSRVKLEEPGSVREKAKLKELEELNKANEQWEALEAKIESEFEAIRSRASNAHVVPNHCGWFSWTQVHPLEKCTLPSFFNGKIPARTPDIYMDIRNWIMRKFHANPNTQIELKDLSELEVGDLDARQEVLEFLDYWGLINYHPFLQVDSTVASSDGDGAAKNDSLIENLFHFEAVESCPLVVLKPNLATPSFPSGFFPESSTAEDLGIPDGPSVEYHCNSCSADCSRKRYHCQKQADFDLCTDCFNSGKFGSDMSSSDFILMEPAEAPGLSGGKWTDQETLLLLEALELFKENWNEIAEHVATKTKAQCMLHFVQMPIEDAFLDLADDTDPNLKETGVSAATTDGTVAPKDVPEAKENKTSPNEGQAQTSTEISKPNDASEIKVCQETPQPPDGTDVEVCPEKSSSKDASEVKVGHDSNENCALKALSEAFEAVGYSLTPENPLSFADVGNPVVALAGFLARLVEPGIATASARSSLKSISGNNPGLQLAIRHCFLLEDPPDDKKEQAGSESNMNEMAGRGGKKDEDNHEDSPKEDKSSPGSDQRNPSSNQGDQDTIVSVSEEMITSNLRNDQSPEKKESKMLAMKEDVNDANVEEPSNPTLPKDHQSSIMEDSVGLASKVPPSSVKGSGGEESEVGEASKSKEAANDADMCDSLPTVKKGACEATVTKSTGEQSKPSGTGVDSTEMVVGSLPKENNEHQQPDNEGMVPDSQPSERNEPQQAVTSKSLNEKVASTAEDQIKEVRKESNSTGAEEDRNIDKLKCAAVTAISAAAVKAKLLADEEDDQIQQLATSLIEKQLHKLETKLTFFNELESVMMRMKEHLDKSRQRLYHERAQIIAARLGLPASSSRSMPPTLPANRIAANYASSIARPPMGSTSTRPPMLRPVGPMVPVPSNPFASTTMAGSSIRPGS